MTGESQNGLLTRMPAWQRNRLIGGLALVALGLFLLVVQFVPAQWMGLLVLPVLALTFTTWSLLTRNFGLLIPGGILGGIGLGTFLLTGPLDPAAESAQAGVFLLSFAAGWAFISMLSPLTGRLHLWPLIPGGILAAVGGLLMAGEAGLQALEWAGKLWPLVLIVLGLGILLRRARR